MSTFVIRFRVTGGGKHFRQVPHCADMAHAVRMFRHFAPTADIYRVEALTPGGDDCQGCAADGPGHDGVQLGSRGHREDCPRAHCTACPDD